MSSPLIRVLGIAAVAMLLAAPTAFAQQTAPPPPTPQAVETDFSDEELDSFAEAYVGVEALRTQYQMQYGEVEDPTEMQNVQQRFAEDATEIIADAGLEADRYDMIIMATQADEELAADVIARIERLQEG